MVDVQGRRDERNVPIKRVGVRNLRHPVTVLDRANGTQRTIATVNLFASLPHHFKGTHMSRFIEVFTEYVENIYMQHFLEMLDRIRISLDADWSYGEIDFPYFLTKHAPATGAASMMDYRCRYIGEVGPQRRDFFVGIDVPVLTVCPCSKEISDRGAHNQRGVVSVTVKLGPFFWIEDVIEQVEAASSSGLYTLLKRADERHVTERAYDHPVFVEDLVRDVVIRLERFADFPWFSVEATNFESIHHHDAFAYAERGDPRERLVQ